MKNEELQKTLQAIELLDQYAASSGVVNTDRAWHLRWEQAFRNVTRLITAMVDKPADKKPDKTKRGKPSTS